MYNSHYTTMISLILLITVVTCASLIYIDNIGEIEAQSTKKLKKEPSIPILKDTNLKT